MSETFGWGAVVLAAITMVSNIADKIINRRAAKDKLEQDVKVALLEANHAKCEQNTEQVKKDLVDCMAKHELAEKKQEESDKKQREIELELVQLRTLIHATANKDQRVTIQVAQPEPKPLPAAEPK